MLSIWMTEWFSSVTHHPSPVTYSPSRFTRPPKWVLTQTRNRHKLALVEDRQMRGPGPRSGSKEYSHG